MSGCAPDRLFVLVVLVCTSTLPVSSSVAAGNASGLDVLNLDEAAVFLRVRPKLVRKMAETHAIPARQIGNVWRFSRSALLEWLANGSFTRTQGATVATRGNAEGTESSTGDLRDLRDLRAKGGGAQFLGQLAQAASNAKPEPTTAPPPTIGERATTPTAEDVALRDQRVLLKRGAVTVDFGLSYSQGEQAPLPGVRVEQRGIGTSTALRYGLQDDFQVRARVPANWRRTTTYADATFRSTASPRTAHDDYVGDASISLLGVAVREAVGRPNVIWSLDSVIPTGPGDKGFGVGLVLSKSYDPAVIFAGLSYLRGFSLDPSNSRRSLAKSNFGLSLGYTYALNDSLALNTVLVGSYRDSHSVDAIAIPAPRESHQLQLGMTWLLARGLYMEPAVTLRLGGVSPDASFSVNIPYTF